MMKMPWGIFVLSIFLYTASFTLFAPQTTLAAAPIAANRSMIVNEDNVRSVTLTATSTNKTETFTYTLVGQPSHGSVTLSGATATYTPTANYYGSDTFTYTAKGSISGTSNTATVSIIVSSVNDAPVATSSRQTTTNKNIAVNLTLDGTDVDGDALTCSVTGATGGTVTSNGCVATFTPARNMTGTGQIFFKMYDGRLYSSLATANITVVATNQAPSASDTIVNGTEDFPANFTVTATDADSDALTFIIQTPPAHGTVTFSGARATYVPTTDYNGTDTFTYIANDGKVNSNSATVSLTLTAINDIPVAKTISQTTDSATPVTITLNASDVDGDTLTYRIITQPTSGTLSEITGNTVTYTPNPSQPGTTSFTYSAADASRSANATVTLTIHAAPVAHALAVATTVNTSVTVHPFITDADSTTFTNTLQTPPAHGTLSLQTNGDWMYTPNATWSGMDTFTYTGNDGIYTSLPATVRINVNPPSGLPGTNIIQAGVNFVHLSSDVFPILQDLGVQAVRQIGDADTTWNHMLSEGGQAMGANATTIRQATHMLGIGTVDTLFRYPTSSCTPSWLDAFDITQFVRTPNTLCMNYLTLAAQEIAQEATTLVAGSVPVRPHVDVGNENYHWIAYDGTDPSAINYTPEEQALVIKTAAETIRSATPGAIINEPSITLSDDISGTWASRVHAAVGTDWFDTQTVNAYDRWEWYPAELATFFSSDRYIPGKLVEITETGRSSDPTGTRTTENTEEKKVAAIFQNFSLFWGAGINTVYWHSFLASSEATSDLRGMGLVDASGTYDSAAYAYKLMTTELVPFQEVITRANDSTDMEYAFMSPTGTTKYVVWGSKNITIPAGVTQMVSVMPNANGSYTWQTVLPGQTLQLTDTPYLLK